MDNPGKRSALLICRLFIGSVFVAASVHKIIDPADFAISVRNYMILPPGWSNFVALTLPWVELFSGTLLIVGIQTKPAALLTTAMLGIFLAAVIYAYSIGLDIECGCFTSSSSAEGRVGVYHIARDGVLLAISAMVLCFDTGGESLLNLIFGKVG